MKKEILIAIIIGFALGLVITFGIWTANQALRQQPQLKKLPPTEQTIPKGATTPTLQPEKFSLIIASPEDNSISTKEKIEVTGIAASGATIVILYPEGEKIIQAGNDGNFSSEITLVGGSNEIKITAYGKNGEEVSKSINIVYSTAEI